MSRILPPSQRQSRNPETPFSVVPFVNLPGVSADPMLFVNHLMAYNHDVSQEVDQTFFLNHLMAYNHDVSQEVDQTFFLITDTDEVVSGPNVLGRPVAARVPASRAQPNPPYRSRQPQSTRTRPRPWQKKPLDIGCMDRS